MGLCRGAHGGPSPLHEVKTKESVPSILESDATGETPEIYGDIQTLA